MKMEIGNQLKRYRAELSMSQEELAEKVYVTRQTVSNWENGKSYPDIHSLLLLSTVFQISLDTLIKGDIEKMKTDINGENIRRFDRLALAYGICFAVMVLAFVPLLRFFGGWGLAAELVLMAVALILSIRLERLKKEYDVQTYREIVAFSNGQSLDEISRQREIGKRPYQKFLLTATSALLGFLAAWILMY